MASNLRSVDDLQPRVYHLPNLSDDMLHRLRNCSCFRDANPSVHIVPVDTSVEDRVHREWGHGSFQPYAQDLCLLNYFHHTASRNNTQDSLATHFGEHQQNAKLELKQNLNGTPPNEFEDDEIIIIEPDVTISVLSENTAPKVQPQAAITSPDKTLNDASIGPHDDSIILDSDTEDEADVQAFKKTTLADFLWNSNDDDSKPVRLINEIKITLKDLRTLRDNRWVNDQVIDAYMQLIEARSMNLNSKVKVFSTFFFTGLNENGYDRVASYTAGVNLFNFDLLLFPIYLNSHWTLFAVSLQRLKFAYLDSLNRSKDAFLPQLAKDIASKIHDYLKRESLRKRATPLEEFDLEPITYNKLCQTNSYDCGVFMCCFAKDIEPQLDFLFDFTAEMIPDVRRRICSELANGTLESN